MHPILLIILLWIFVGVVSLVTALGLKVLLPPVGPFVAAVVGLVVGVGAVFAVFITRADRRARRKIQARIGGEDLEDTIDRYYEEASADPRTTE
jgi:predicted RND superfamily exporter protein